MPALMVGSFHLELKILLLSAETILNKMTCSAVPTASYSKHKSPHIHQLNDIIAFKLIKLILNY